jgi:hypothetical protein
VKEPPCHVPASKRGQLAREALPASHSSASTTNVSSFLVLLDYPN